MADYVLEEDSLEQDYLRSRQQAALDHGPAAAALKRHLPPEDFAQVAAKLGMSNAMIGEPSPVAIKGDVGDGYSMTLEVPPSKGKAGAGAGDAGGGASGASPQAIAMRFFQSRGWTPYQAAGIVGNLDHESGGMQHAIEGDGGASFGLAQWNKERRAQLMEYAATKGEKEPSFQTQLEFVDWELRNSEKNAGDALARAATIQEATQVVSDLYERPGNPMMASRMARAMKAAGVQQEGEVQLQPGDIQWVNQVIAKAGEPQYQGPTPAVEPGSFWEWFHEAPTKEGVMNALNKTGDTALDIANGLFGINASREMYDAWLKGDPEKLMAAGVDLAMSGPPGADDLGKIAAPALGILTGPLAKDWLKSTGKKLLLDETGTVKIPPLSKPSRAKYFENDPKALFKITDKLEGLEQHIKGDLPIPKQKYAININLNRLETPDDIKALVDGVAGKLPIEIDDARRGAISRAGTQKLARELGWSEETLLTRQRGQAFNAEQVTAARWVLMDSANNLLDLAKRVRSGENSDEMLALFRQALSKHAAIQAQVSGMAAEAGRALASFNIMAKSGEMRYAQEVKDIVGKAGGRGQIEDMAAILTDALEANGGKIDPATLSSTVRQLQRATTRDMLFEVWINALLSGPQTHTANMLSNALVAVTQAPERKIASWISQGPMGSGEIAAGEAKAQMMGMVNGFMDALRLSSKALRSGTGSFGKLDTPMAAITAENVGKTWLVKKMAPEGLEAGGIAARAIDLLGHTVRMPSRFLGAEDEFFKGIAYRMELNARAYRQGVSEGLEGERLTSRMGEIIANPPEDLKAAAMGFADYATFTNPLGEGGQALMAALNKIPMARVVVPFFKTPVNILKYSIERTPLAPVMASVRSDIMAGGARRDLALAKISLGSMICGTAAVLSSAGLITGQGPADKDMRDILRRKGWQPYSFKLGDTYISYNRLDPLGMNIGMAADVAEIIGQVGEAEADKLAGALVASVSQNVLSKTYLKGMSDFVEVFSSAQRYENANRGAEYLKKELGSIIPSFLAQTARAYDPTQRDVSRFAGMDAVLASMKSRIPGYSKDLPPRRNLWGEPIVIEGGLGPDIISPIYTSTEKQSPVDDELFRLKLPVKMPAPTLHGVPLLPNEYDRFVQLAGNAAKNPSTGLGLKESLEKLVNSPEYQRQSEGIHDDEDAFMGGKAMLILGQVRAYRELAKAQLMKEFPDLKDAVEGRLRDKAKALKPSY